MKALLECLMAPLLAAACAMRISSVEQCRADPGTAEAPYFDMAFSCAMVTGSYGSIPGCEDRDAEMIELKSDPTGSVVARYVQGYGVPVRLLQPELKKQLPWTDFDKELWVEIETICGERGWVPWMTLNSFIVAD